MRLIQLEDGAAAGNASGVSIPLAMFYFVPVAGRPASPALILSSFDVDFRHPLDQVRSHWPSFDAEESWSASAAFIKWMIERPHARL